LFVLCVPQLSTSHYTGKLYASFFVYLSPYVVACLIPTQNNIVEIWLKSSQTNKRLKITRFYAFANNDNIIVPFSERKGYMGVKYTAKICKNQRVCPIQAGTSISIFRLFRVLIKVYYRLSIPRSLNLKSDFLPSFHWSEMEPIKDKHFDEKSEIRMVYYRKRHFTSPFYSGLIFLFLYVHYVRTIFPTIAQYTDFSFSLYWRCTDNFSIILRSTLIFVFCFMLMV
jgi:hypothetical protein